VAHKRQVYFACPSKTAKNQNNIYRKEELLNLLKTIHKSFFPNCTYRILNYKAER
jgi:hypothetical protein